jgi:DNA polymerase-3 subunit gamma/tau
VNALTSGKVAHAYLLTGIRGSGKTTTARLIAKALNCAKAEAAEPCNTCEACSAITHSHCVDVLEIDAASNRGIDEIRSIKENVKYLGTLPYKVYIIDEVHMLTLEAFNALLKTLEEPPPHVVFILATTDPHKVPITISSRCQPLDFRPVEDGVLEKLIEKICKEEKVTIEKAALSLVIKHATGSFRDAISLIDQLGAYTSGKITEEAVISLLGHVDKEQFRVLSACIIAKDVKEAIPILGDLIRGGVGAKDIIENLIELFRDKVLKEDPAVSFEELDQMLSVLIDAYDRIEASELPDIILELTVIRLCKIRPIEKLDTLIEKIENLRVSPAEPMRHVDKKTKEVGISQPQEKISEEKNEIPHVKASSIEFDWTGFVKRFSEEKPNLGSCLAHSYFLEFDGKRILVGFGKNSFYFDRVNNDSTKKIIKSYVHNFYGKELEIAFTTEEKPAHVLSYEENTREEAKKRLRETEERLKAHPSVAEVIESFGGEIVEVEEIKEREN